MGGWGAAQVDCFLSHVPRELCALSRLELLGLPANSWLVANGAFRLGSAPLSLLTSCRRASPGRIVKHITELPQ